MGSVITKRCKVQLLKYLKKCFEDFFILKINVIFTGLQKKMVEHSYKVLFRKS